MMKIVVVVVEALAMLVGIGVVCWSIVAVVAIVMGSKKKGSRPVTWIRKLWRGLSRRWTHDRFGRPIPTAEEVEQARQEWLAAEADLLRVMDERDRSGKTIQ